MLGRCIVHLSYDINHIHFLLDDLGNRIESQVDIQDHCINYFKDLLGSDQAQPLFFQDDLNSLLGFSCSLDQRNRLAAVSLWQKLKRLSSLCLEIRPAVLTATLPNSLWIAGALWVPRSLLLCWNFFLRGLC